MFRKPRIMAAVLIIPASLLITSGGSSAAGRVMPPPVDATNYTVSCSSFSGAFHFRPRLVSNLGPFTGNVKGEVSGCTAVPNGGGAPIDIVDGKVTGPLTFELTNDQGDCDAVLGYPNGTIYPIVGALTIRWRTRRNSPALSSGNTVIQPTSLITQSGGGAASLSVPGSPGGVSGTGSFEGTDAGGSDSVVFGIPDTAKVFSQCFTPPGLGHLDFGGVALDLG